MKGQRIGYGDRIFGGSGVQPLQVGKGFNLKLHNIAGGFAELDTDQVNRLAPILVFLGVVTFLDLL